MRLFYFLWTSKVSALWLVNGYALIHADYPPLAATILYATRLFFQSFFTSSLLGIKLSILFFLC